MCGIIGAIGRKNGLGIVEKGLKLLVNRGKDDQSIFSSGNSDVVLGHVLHAIIGHVAQPLKGKGILAANCEIYNWKDLNSQYSLGAKNDAEMLLRLIDNKGIKNVKDVLSELDGVYAFAYFIDGKIVIARDLLGIKPLWYDVMDGLCFASEKKVLEKTGSVNPLELNPRKIIIYDVSKKRIEFLERKFFEIMPEWKEKKEMLKEKVKKLLVDAIKKRVPGRKFGVLFSGGLDSSFIALALKELGHEFTCYTSVLDSKTMKEPEDLGFSVRVAKSLGVPLKIVKVKEKDVEKKLKKIVPLIEDSNVVKVGVALPFYSACEQAKKDGCKVIFSGLGSEEIFAGYQRHKTSGSINKECVSGLLKVYERDTYRDDVITMHHNIELRVPFLDVSLVEYALKIPDKFKVKDGIGKQILREIAEEMGLSKEFAWRKRKAAQYGSNFHKAIKKLAKKNGFKLISAYLREFYPKHNVKLGALVSSGKDSVYAMHVMMKQNYGVECMITLKSKNPDSYMFHTPGIDMVNLQAKSIGIPLIEQATKGEKEDELSDLKKALEKAVAKYKIEGIVTGALFSNYQRTRIEKVADELGLKVFAPLWHMDQETEMRQIIDEGFEFIIAKVMCDGLNKTWLNNVIYHDDVDKLVKLNERVGINIAFEGGEAETLMIDGPIFSKKIAIVKSSVSEENENVAELIIEKAQLVEK